MSSDSVPWRRQSNQITSSNGSTPQPGGEQFQHTGPPPPPPPPIQGGTSIRIPSEIGSARKGYEPPAAIQNAMMTKDKKPFTYTPGGLDLAEIRSPRMARRINRNAHMEDSCSGPQLKSPAPAQPHSLPPAAIAAMQPQIAIPVFPPGSDSSSAGHHTSSAPQTSSGGTAGTPPPPPPMPSAGGTVCPPPPPPPPPLTLDGSIPLQMQSNQTNNNQQTPRLKNGNHSPPTYLQDIQNRPALRPVGQSVGQSRPPPDFVNEIPCHTPLKPVNHPPRSSYEPTGSSPIQVQLKPVSPKAVSSSQNSSPPYIPQPPLAQNQLKQQESSLYTSMPQSPNTIQDSNFQGIPQQKQVYPPKPNVYIPPNHQSPQSITPVRQTPPSPATLNKSPAPWMTSRHVQKESPPWTLKQGSPEDKSTSSPQPSGGTLTRVIPVQVEGRDPPSNYQQQMAQQMQQMHIQMQQQMQQQQRQMQQQMNVNVAPQYNTLPRQESPQSGRTRIIPIQIEGAYTDTNNQQKNLTYPNHNNSPAGFGQNQNRFQNSPQGEGIQRTLSVDATDSRSRQLQSQVSWTQGNGNPIQSRSFRVLQKITGSEDQPSEPINQAQSGETYLVNRVLPMRQDRLDESEY